VRFGDIAANTCRPLTIENGIQIAVLERMNNDDEYISARWLTATALS